VKFVFVYWQALVLALPLLSRTMDASMLPPNDRLRHIASRAEESSEEEILSAILGVSLNISVSGCCVCCARIVLHFPAAFPSGCVMYSCDLYQHPTSPLTFYFPVPCTFCCSPCIFIASLEKKAPDPTEAKEMDLSSMYFPASFVSAFQESNGTFLLSL